MKIKKILLGVVMLFLFSSPVYADRMINVDEKIQKMKTDLNLTQDQADRIRPIIQDYKDKMEKAHKDKEDKLNQVLSADQMKKLKDMKKAEEQEEKEEGEGEGR